MKQLFTLLAITFFSFGLQAQYLDVTDIYFANAPNDTPLPDNALTPGASVVLHFKFTNNLSNQQGINPGDKISFGWHTLGTTVVDTLGTMSWPAPLPNGQSATLYAHHNTTLPPDSCVSWEVCMWPLHNPYSPNTDQTKGRHCTKFKTIGCTGLSTSDLISDVNESNFYIANHSVHFQFPTGSKNNRIELYDLIGNRVLSETVSEQGLIKIYNETISGVYVLRAINSESEVIKKVFIQ